MWGCARRTLFIHLAPRHSSVAMANAQVTDAPPAELRANFYKKMLDFLTWRGSFEYATEGDRRREAASRPAPVVMGQLRVQSVD